MYAYVIEKWNHTGFRRYFANMSWMFAGRIFVMAIAFFVNIYMARYLGPENYGLLNYTFSFVGLFGFLASLGIENVLSREIIKDHSRKDEIIGTAFFLKFGGSVLAFIVMVLAAWFSTDDIVLIGLISLYSLIYIFSAFGVIDTYFQSQVLSKYPTIIMIAGGVVSALLKVVIMIAGGGLIWLVGVYTLEGLLSMLGLLYFFFKKGHTFKAWRFDPRIAISILKDSLPLMLSGVAVTVYMDIDQIIVKHMLGNESAGVYAVAVKLSEVWYFIPGVIAGALFPAIVNAKKVGQELYEARLKKLYFLMFWLPVGIAAATTVFAHYAVLFLFGQEFIGAVSSLRIYVWAGIATSLGFALSQYLVTENFTAISALTSVCGALINIVLNVILIPLYGIDGAAYATLISYVSATFSIVLFKKTRKHALFILKSLIPRF